MYCLPNVEFSRNHFVYHKSIDVFSSPSWEQGPKAFYYIIIVGRLFGIDVWMCMLVSINSCIVLKARRQILKPLHMRHTSLPPCSFPWCLYDFQPILFYAHLLPSRHLCCAIGISDTHIFSFCIKIHTNNIMLHHLEEFEYFKTLHDEFHRIHTNLDSTSFFPDGEISSCVL